MATFRFIPITFRSRLSDPRVSRRQRGQGLTEYALMVSLVAVGAIAAVTFFGSKVSTKMNSVSEALETAAPVQGAAGVAPAGAPGPTGSEGRASSGARTFSENLMKKATERAVDQGVRQFFK